MAKPSDTKSGHDDSGGLPVADLADRDNVGCVSPDSYPLADRKIASFAGNRGQRRSAGSGEVEGSGAGAGGAGAPEDYDSDAQAGGGRFPEPGSRAAPGSGADAPVDGSR
jgi:hypothetical protein